MIRILKGNPKAYIGGKSSAHAIALHFSSRKQGYIVPRSVGKVIGRRTKDQTKDRTKDWTKDCAKDRTKDRTKIQIPII